jgi:K+-transporting ATPase ATPase C chain
MFQTIKTSLVILMVLTVLTGLVYPLVVTGLAQVIFPDQANGSLIRSAGGGLSGSDLIGQNFTSPAYFWGRLSATAGNPYNASASGGSNYSTLNPALEEAAQARIEALQAADPGNTLPIPVDLVTASASGLDPHISPVAAEYQVSRVARSRGLTEDQVRTLVTENTEKPFLGILGEKRVNVLQLNLALDSVQ